MAQAMELRRRFPIDGKLCFEEGQFVRRRAAHEIFMRPGTVVLAFVRYLTESPEDIAVLTDAIRASTLSIMGPKPDCIVMSMSDCGGVVNYSITSSCLLEIDDRVELLAAD